MHMKYQQKKYQGQEQQPVNQAQETEPVQLDRRSVIRKLAVGTAALAGCSVLPEKWTTPFVEFGTLPAHATTSGSGEVPQELIDIIEQRQGDEETVATAETDQGTASSEEQQATEAKAAENNDLRGYNNTLTINDSGALMSCDGIYQHKIVFPKLGPQYGKSFLLVWSDAKELSVSNSAHMVMNPGKSDARKYQPGGAYSNNPDIPTMEVYAKRGTHPDSVTLYY